MTIPHENEKHQKKPHQKKLVLLPGTKLTKY